MAETTGNQQQRSTTNRRSTGRRSTAASSSGSAGAATRKANATRRSTAAKRGAATRARNEASANTRRTTRRAEKEARGYVGQVSDLAERAILVQTGAAVSVGERLVGAVETATSPSKLSRSLRDSREGVRKQLKSFERRGTTTRRDVQRQAKKGRTQVKRELKSRRRGVERELKSRRRDVERELKTRRDGVERFVRRNRQHVENMETEAAAVRRDVGAQVNLAASKGENTIQGAVTGTQQAVADLTGRADQATT